MNEKPLFSNLWKILALGLVALLPVGAFAQYSLYGISGQTKVAENLNGGPAVLDPSDYFGKAVANIGDVDGNGVPDLAVSAEGDDDGGSNKGAVYILFIDASGSVMGTNKISQTAGNFTGNLNASNNNFGRSVVGIGDLNKDGTPDILVGDDGDDDGGFSRGAVYVLFLQPNGNVAGHAKISSTVGGFTGPLDNNDDFGRSVGYIGDLDGDGFIEVAVGANHDDDGGSGRGAVYILSLNESGKVIAEQKISDTQGNFLGILDNNDRFGSEVAGIGDLDGDGFPDMVVSAPNDDDGGTDRGAVYVLFLEPTGHVHHHAKISDTQGNFLGALDNYDNFGLGVYPMPDLECTGHIGLAVGAWRDDDGGTDKGAVWMINLNPNGTANGHWKIAENQGGFVGPLNNIDRFGMSITNMGDINGDNIADIVVGMRHDDYGGTDQGSVWILNGLGQRCPTGKAVPQPKLVDGPLQVKVYDLTGRLIWEGDSPSATLEQIPPQLPRQQLLIVQYWQDGELFQTEKRVVE